MFWGKNLKGGHNMNTTKKLNCVNGSSLMLVNDERQICEF